MSHQIATRVDDELKQQVTQLAEQNNISQAKLARRAISEFVDRNNIDPPTPETDQEALEQILSREFDELPHDTPIDLDPDCRIDFSDKSVVSKTYKKRFLLLDNWMDSRTSQEEFERLEREVFDLSVPTIEKDARRLEEMEIVIRDPFIDPDWGRTRLRDEIDMISRSMANGLGMKTMRKTDKSLFEMLADINEALAVFDGDFLRVPLYNARVRKFGKRLSDGIDALEDGTTTEEQKAKMLRVVLFDFYEYVSEKDCLNATTVDKLDDCVLKHRVGESESVMDDEARKQGREELDEIEDAAAADE